MKRSVLLGFLALLMGESPAQADFADAVKAYDGGDYATAFAESLEAAKQGDPDAQYMAGFLYLRGQGVRRDLMRAYQWLTLAARQGDDFAADELEDITPLLNAAVISRAEEWLRNWTPAK